MENGHSRPKSLLEAALLILFIVAYVIIGVYNISTPTVPHIALAASLDLVIGMAILFTVVLITEAYGKIIKSEDAAYEVVSLVRLLGYPALGIDLLNGLGVNVTSLLVGAGFLGIVIGLAAQTTMGNLFAGFAILYTKPFKSGDKISVSTPQYSFQSPSHPHGMLEVEVTGFVKSIGMMHTRILRDDMTMVFIPNSVINVGLITNYSRAPERLVVLRADIGKRINTAELKKFLLKAFKTPEFSAVRELGINTATITTDLDVGIIVTARVSQIDYHRMREAMADRLNEALLKYKK
ncbi:MAG: mechanosensitive ion channel family protein [Candidatus Micrarchaeota archaeon]|nr:mechanosensitive ion channel family protein [Candidatus Micrarchaeota archaeon]